jgi:hypothetical protein
MQADGSLERDRQRGQLAQAVLDNPIYAEAHEAIEAEIIRQWREARNADDREQLHQLMLTHAKVKAVLEAVMRTGTVAAAELDRKMGRAEAMARASLRAA